MTMRTPTSAEIKHALDSGATAADIDDLFYPGEAYRFKQLKAAYPIPEGTGRDLLAVKRKPENGRTTNYYAGDTWIGSIYDAWKGCNGGNGYYQTHDGKKFAHWGGPTGAETYLIDRYWLYGNPPEKTTIRGILKNIFG
jgi:hypothetical protein